MAISAKFIADFSSFQAAVAQAEVSLRSFETGAGKVEKSLNKMADSFSGRKIVQDAELATRAVTEIGGATKLTENEQARLNATLNEALAKYKALGIQAPADMVALATATKKVDTELGKIPAKTTDIMGGLGKLAGAFGIAFSVGAVVNFGKSVFDSASKIHDLALQLGISAEAVQGFKFAAEQSGSSLDAVGTAITKMNQKLGAGEASTVSALRAAGLSFADIRNMKPEDAFLAIADAIQKIPDPMKQSQVAMELFARGGAELLPGIKEGFRSVADAASKMSNQTINDLEAAGDAWGKLADKVTIVTGQMIAASMSVTSHITSSWKNFGQFVENSVKFGFGSAAAMADLTAAAMKPPDVNMPAGKLPPLVDAAATKAVESHAKAIRELADAFSGLTAMRAANDEMEALALNIKRGITLSKGSIESQDALNKKLSLGIDGYARFGKVAPEAMRLAYMQTTHLSYATQGLVGDFQNVGVKLEKFVIPNVNNFTGAWPTTIPGLAKMLDDIPRLGKVTVTATKEVKDHLGDLSAALAQLSQVSGGAFGGIAQGLSTIVSSMNVAKKAQTALNEGFAQISSGETLAGLAGVASGLASIASAGIAIGNALGPLLGLKTGKLGELLGTNASGRSLVNEFAEMMGGYDALHQKLLLLGDAGEQLWIKLTQGVGRANAGQAQAAIDEVTAALEDMEDQQGDTTAATEEQAQATIETAAQAALALDELGVRLKINAEEWGEWSEDVTGYLQKLADDIRSLPLPAPGGASTGASSPGSLPFTAGRGGAASRPAIQTVVMLDRKVLAESMAEEVLA